jgi:hypothetical protein
MRINAEEKTLDALAARITRLERGIVWASTFYVGWMAAQHTGISHYLISGIRGQLLSSSDVFEIAHTSHGVVGRDQVSLNDQNELPFPRSPPHPPTVPTISKLRSHFEEVDLPSRSHPTHNIAQDESMMALSETVLLARQGKPNNGFNTGRHLLEESNIAVYDDESEFCSQDVCGVDTFCDSLFFQRWTYLREEMHINELHDMSSVQHNVACHLLNIDQQRSPDEPDLNMDDGRLIQTFATTVLLWGDENYENRNLQQDSSGKGWLASILMAVMVGVAVVGTILLALVAACAQRFCWKKLRDRIIPSGFLEIGSVYWFALPGGSWIGLLVFGCTVALQLATFVSFLSYIWLDREDAEKRIDGDTNCNYNCAVYNTGDAVLWDYIPAAVVLIIYLMKDIVMSLRIIIRGGATKSIRVVLVGSTMLMMTTVALGTTLMYFIQLQPSRTDSLTNAVGVIIINDIDEKLFEMLRCVCPLWVQRQRAHYLQWVDEEEAGFLQTLTSNFQ